MAKKTTTKEAEEELQAEAESTETPAAAETDQERETPPTPDEPEETPEETEESPAKRPLSERLGDMDDADWEELLSQDRIKGRLGQIADKRARELKREEDEKALKEAREKATRDETERLRRLRRTDLAAYNAEMDAREAAEEYQRKEGERTRALAETFVQHLDSYVSDKFPAEIKTKLDSKSYTNEGFVEGVTHYIDDLITEERADLKRQIERELRPVLRKQILTELNGGESPEPANGGRGKTKSQQAQDFQTEEEASIAFANKEINVQQLREIYLKHHWRF